MLEKNLVKELWYLTSEQTLIGDRFQLSAWNLKENTSSFRLASYDVPYLNSKADLSITKFPSAVSSLSFIDHL